MRKNNLKNGFTLIELLSVIIILAIIALTATPIVLNVVNDAKVSARDSKLKMYADSVKIKATENYFTNVGNVDGEYQTIDLNNSNTICEKAYYLNSKIYLGNCTVDGVNNLYYIDGKIETNSTNYDATVAQMIYKDNTNANVPDLLDKMVAVKYNGTSWVVADTTQQWYNYANKEWANAAIFNTGITKTVGQTIDVATEVAMMYVWIPRYKYTIFNGTGNVGVPPQQINVEFETVTDSTGTVTCNDSISGSGTLSEICADKNGSIINGTSTYTHPAFTFGTTELTGIWVGKFESSNITVCTPELGSIDTACDLTTLGIQIKPNVTSWRGARISTFYSAIKNIVNDYSMTNADSHMMKNMEWGMVSYLKQSQYGLGITDIGINNNSNFITGCGAAAENFGVATCDVYNSVNGQKASTTGNIYGIYDMSGGAMEYVMGDMVTSGNVPMIGNSSTKNSGFTGMLSDGTSFSGISLPNVKYYELYTYGTSYITHSRGKFGDATKETLKTYGNHISGGWYLDYAFFVSDYGPWFLRGGDYGNDASSSGMFCFTGNNGNARTCDSARTVISRIN